MIWNIVFKGGPLDGQFRREVAMLPGRLVEAVEVGGQVREFFYERGPDDHGLKFTDEDGKPVHEVTQEYRLMGGDDA